MQFNEYMRLAKSTDLEDYSPVAMRMQDHTLCELDHAADGMVTEAAEFKDILKKAKMYGKPVDRVHALEEIGDQLWYIARALRSLDATLEDCCERNIAKLKARYGEKFTEAKALNRDLDQERKILEG